MDKNKKDKKQEKKQKGKQEKAAQVINGPEQQGKQEERHVFFHKSLALDELYILMQIAMQNAGIQYVAGLSADFVPEGGLAPERVKLILKQGESRGIFTGSGGENAGLAPALQQYAVAWIGADKVLTVRQSLKESRVITVCGSNGMYLATIQDSADNTAVLMMDDDPTLILREAGITGVNITSGYDTASVKNGAAGYSNVSGEAVVTGRDGAAYGSGSYRFAILPLDNRTGIQSGLAELFIVGTDEFQLMTGEKTSDFKSNTYEASQLEPLVTDIIREACATPRKDNYFATKEMMEKEDPEPYTRFSFRKLAGNLNFPHSLPQMLKLQFKSGRKQKGRWKQILKSLAVKAGITSIFFFWNMYGLCYLNDTFMIGNGNDFLGNATPYLMAGRVNAGSTLFGFGKTFPFTIPTILISGSFSMVMGAIFRCVIQNIRQKKFLGGFAGLPSLGGNVRHYLKATGKSFGEYFWMALLVVAPLSFIITNPFTVGLLSVLLLLSCAKQDSGMVSSTAMTYSSVINYKKVVSGAKKEPLFGEFQLKLLGAGLAMLLYTGLNALTWLLFSYNFIVRLIFTVALTILAFINIKAVRGKNTARQVAAGLLIFTAVTAVFVMVKSSIMAYADDGGWSESGGSIPGLLQNSGFPEIFGFSVESWLTAFVGSLPGGKQFLEGNERFWDKVVEHAKQFMKDQQDKKKANQEMLEHIKDFLKDPYIDKLEYIKDFLKNPDIDKLKDDLEMRKRLQEQVKLYFDRHTTPGYEAEMRKRLQWQVENYFARHIPPAPAGPVTPSAPVTPATPGTPSAPVSPGAPVTPGGPVAPGNPGTPSAPVTPGTPSEPAAPGAPSVSPSGGGHAPAARPADPTYSPSLPARPQNPAGSPGCTEPAATPGTPGTGGAFNPAAPDPSYPGGSHGSGGSGGLDGSGGFYGPSGPGGAAPSGGSNPAGGSSPGGTSGSGGSHGGTGHVPDSAPSESPRGEVGRLVQEPGPKPGGTLDPGIFLDPDGNPISTLTSFDLLRMLSQLSDDEFKLLVEEIGKRGIKMDWKMTNNMIRIKEMINSPSGFDRNRIIDILKGDLFSVTC